MRVQATRRRTIDNIFARPESRSSDHCSRTEDRSGLCGADDCGRPRMSRKSATLLNDGLPPHHNSTTNSTFSPLPALQCKHGHHTAQCGPPGDVLRDQVMAAKDLVGAYAESSGAYISANAIEGLVSQFSSSLPLPHQTKPFAAITIMAQVEKVSHTGENPLVLSPNANKSVAKLLKENPYVAGVAVVSTIRLS